MTPARNGVRRFTISDGMILVAALAVGLAWTSKLAPVLFRSFSPGHSLGVSQLERWDLVFMAAVLAMPTLLIVTLVLPVLRLRGPRPTWRRLARQPGMVASLAAVLTLLTIIAVFFLTASLYPRSILPSVREAFTVEYIVGLIEIVMLAAPLIGLAVASVWASLLLQHRWRCEPSLVDRLGRLVGSAWLAMVPIMGVFWMSYYIR